MVLSVLRGEQTQVEAARRLEMSQTTIAKWQKQFLEGAHEGLARGDNAKAPASKREAELQANIDDLTTAPGKPTWSSGSGGKGWLSTLVRGARGHPHRGADERATLLRTHRDPP